MGVNIPLIRIGEIIIENYSPIYVICTQKFVFFYFKTTVHIKRIKRCDELDVALWP